MACIASSFVGSVAALKATKVQVRFYALRVQPCFPFTRRLACYRTEDTGRFSDFPEGGLVFSASLVCPAHALFCFVVLVVQSKRC